MYMINRLQSTTFNSPYVFVTVLFMLSEMENVRNINVIIGVVLILHVRYSTLQMLNNGIDRKDIENFQKFFVRLGKHDCFEEYQSNDGTKYNAQGGVLPASNAFSCFGKCILYTLNLADEQGVINKEKFVKIFPSTMTKQINKLLNQCFPQTPITDNDKESGCRSIFNLVRCITEEIPELVKYLPF